MYNQYGLNEGIRRKKPEKFNVIPLRKFTPDEVRRIDEIVFFTIFDQMSKSKVRIGIPVGATIPELLATITNTNPGVINHAYNTLALDHNKPTNDEVGIALKMHNVSAAKSMFTVETYYKTIRRYRSTGQLPLVPVLSQIQHQQVKKFIINYAKIFLGKRQSIAHLTKDYLK